MSEVIDSEKCVYLTAPSSFFRTPFGNKPVKGSKKLLNTARKHFYANVPLISNIFSCGSYLLTGSEILGRLFNMLAAVPMYSSYN